MTDTLNRPTVDERLALASSSTRLVATRDLDGSGGAIGSLEMVGAAGLASQSAERDGRASKYALGRLVLALEAEWSSIARAGSLTNAPQWIKANRDESMVRMRSLRPAHALLTAWATEQRIKKAERRALTMLVWWLDRHCSACHGTAIKPRDGRGVDQQCEACEGTGEKGRPCAHDGQALAQRLSICRAYAVKKVAQFAAKYHEQG